MVPASVLLVEDNEDILANLYAYLEPLGYELDCARNGRTGLEMAASGQFDLVVLDIMLPGLDGISLCRALRGEHGVQVPVIMLTARDTVADRVLGLDAGADDYVSKPFGMMELMARIRTALRHSGGEAEPVHALTLGPLRIDPARHQVLAHGREVTLTLKEFQLLSLLVEHAGTVFTRDQLLNTIWGYEFDGASRTVDVHVRTLRQKLGEAGRCIETVRGVGYKAESDPSKSEEQP